MLTKPSSITSGRRSAPETSTMKRRISSSTVMTPPRKSRASRGGRLPGEPRGAAGRTGACSREEGLSVTPRGAATGLSGGQHARRRRHGPRPHPDEPDPRNRRGEPDRDRRSGRDHGRSFQRRGRTGTLLPARPRLPERLHARRQRRGERGRPPGSQIRRHPELCHGPLGPPVRRHGVLSPGENASRTWPATRCAICWSAAKGPSGSSPR